MQVKLELQSCEISAVENKDLLSHFRAFRVQ